MEYKMPYYLKHFVFCFLLIHQLVVIADDSASTGGPYQINPGDVLEISVWKEESLRREVRVLTDGHISFPLAGDLGVSGLSVNQAQAMLVKKLSEYLVDPVVNVSVISATGNLVYVIGQVKKPGHFVMYQPLNVMQLLSLAGGLTAFAKENDILILRTTNNGSEAIEFEYGELEDGDDLEKNHLLKSGDVIVVP